MSTRTPEALLAELGVKLDEAASADARRRTRRPARVLAGVVVAVLVLAGSAAATRSIWAPDAPSNAPHGPTAQVGGAVLGGRVIAVDARTCTGGRVSVVVRTPGGGAAAPCGHAGVFVEPTSGHGLAFGRAPRGTIEVATAAGRGVVLHAGSDVVRRAALPRDAVYFVVALPEGELSLRAVRFTCAVRAGCAG
jgi:hypothetical protein